MQNLQKFKDNLLKKKAVNDKALIAAHHRLMKEYGWIPLKEFMEIPIPTLFNLLIEIKKEHDVEAKSMEKGKSKRRSR